METGEEREGSRGFSVTTLILIRAAFLFADPFFPALFNPREKDWKRRESDGGWWGRAYAAGLVRSRPDGEESRGGSIYLRYLAFVYVLPDECSGIYSFFYY